MSSGVLLVSILPDSIVNEADTRRPRNDPSVSELVATPLTYSVDMEMHRCLPVLQEQNMGAGKTADELEKDRPLVIGARVWLAVSPRSTWLGCPLTI